MITDQTNIPQMTMTMTHSEKGRHTKLNLCPTDANGEIVISAPSGAVIAQRDDRETVNFDKVKQEPTPRLQGVFSKHGIASTGRSAEKSAKSNEKSVYTDGLQNDGCSERHSVDNSY